MINIFIYFFLMFMLFMLSFMMSLMMYYKDSVILLEWLMMSVNSINVELIILMDWISLLFVSFVLLISSMIMIYSYVYMYLHNYVERFIYLVMLFVASMILMIMSPNMISIMFGWDGLGLVSYCLVIFYQNYISYNSGMVTILCNRVGDIGILLAISVMVINGGWNFMMIGDYFWYAYKLVTLMLLFAVCTKSAQLPFSSWLPAAMAAPTPVSALVHSSTLVTAGVYLMIRYNPLLMYSELNEWLFVVAVLTTLMSGAMALMEMDLKKIIALSTLSQLGLMMMILSMGFSLISFYHLLTHAIFKSMLFMCSGVIIHSMFNSQDIRVLGGLNEVIPFTMLSFYISNLALCGFPFLSGFYSKDLIMEMVYSEEVNMLMFVIIIMSLMFTVSYSFRLFYYMFFGEVKFYSYKNFYENMLMNISMMILILLSMMIGSMLNWMFFYDCYLVYLPLKVKMVTFEGCLLGVVIGGVIVVKNSMKYYLLSYFLSSMWFLNYMYAWIYKSVLELGVKSWNLDKMYFEFMGSFFVSYLVKYFLTDKFVYNIYMFSFLFIYFWVLIYLMY